jgi:hypothetical protein
MKLRTVSIVLTIFALVSAAQAGVKVDYDTEIDFSKFESFGWMQGSNAPNELVQKRIESAIDTPTCWS